MNSPDHFFGNKGFARLKSTLTILALVSIVGLVSLVAAYGTEPLLDGGLIKKFLSYFDKGPERQVPTVLVKRQDYTIIVRAEGSLVGLYSVPVRVPRVRRGSMRIAWLAPEGSVVARGDALVRFDETEARLALQQGESQLETQSYRIENSRLRQGGEMRQLEMDQQSADLDLSFSKSQVRKDGTIFSQWEIRESLMNADLAQSRLGFLKDQQGLQEELGESQLRELDVERTSVQAEVDLAKEALSALSVAAPAPGVVVYRKLNFTPPEVGSTVWGGQQVMEISSADRFRAIVAVPEMDIGSIAEGNLTEVVLNSFPDRKLTGRIESISRVTRQLNRKDPRQYFECSVLIDVDADATDLLKPGMDLEVAILVEKLADAFVLPRSAVFSDGSRTFVFVPTGNSEYQDQEVKIVSSDHGFHVVEGLEDGTEVCLRHPDQGDEMALPDFSTPTGATRASEFVIVE